MAPKKIPARPTPVDAIHHSDKRTNIPTADAREFITPEIEAARKVRYARDESLDPQLVWKGKYPDAGRIEEADPDLVIDAPPIYIQEKMDPRVLIESLRRTAARSEDEPELTLFDTFDGLDELDSVDFYRHDANWSNRMILGDSLQVMASLAEREQLRGKVQMIYVDPPYGIKFGSNWQVRVDKRDVKDGKLDDAAREAEQIKAFRDTWELGIHSYLSYLRDRLLVARDLLVESGSCFVQIGDENLHLVRGIMDEIFGAENFIAQIAYKSKKMPLGETFIFTSYDYVVWYGRNRGVTKFRRLFRERALGEGTPFTSVLLADGSTRAMTADERDDPALLPAGTRAFRALDLVSAGRTESCVFPFEFDQRVFEPGRGKSWKTNSEGIKRLIAAGRIIAPGTVPVYTLLHEDYPVQEIENVWSDTQGASDKLYVVQTTEKVVERCLMMATDPGDLVVDPTCGSGTTAYVSEQWGRRWVTIDTSRVALALARQRLMAARYPWYLLADTVEGQAKERSLAAQPYVQQEFGGDIRQGFVYERVPHVTLGSITNNPDIREGMTREQIDAGIKRHAEFEVLYDKPYDDKGKVRVTGPFTVESLSPHRSLSFAGDPGQESLGETEAAKEADAPSFEQTILDNLTVAGIQNGRRNERIKFASFETYAGQYIQAVGEQGGEDEGDARARIGIAIGPQYGTVSTSFIKQAAREAIKAENIDLLAILGFAFDPQVTGLTEEDGVTVDASEDGFANVAGIRNLGRIPVVIVRMNVDLLMGEALKKTNAANLFTVFGEPDIEIRSGGDEVVVEIKGVDVYDPTTGEVRSNSTREVALWMIDTDYNEESFFVRHCYFTGDNDPYKRLRTALKADIDSEAWETLYKTVSRPFPNPSTGKIAVKVINDYGDEVMKVFEIA